MNISVDSVAFWDFKYSISFHYRLAYFKAAYALYEAEFYVKIDDDVYLRPGDLIVICFCRFHTRILFCEEMEFNLWYLYAKISDRLSLLLVKERTHSQTYLGCMKKGPVFTDPKLKWLVLVDSRKKKKKLL